MGPVLKPAQSCSGAGSCEHLWTTVVGKGQKVKDQNKEGHLNISQWVPPLTAEIGDLLLTSNLQINKLVCVPALLSLWHIRDLQNEAQSGIKGPNGKQLILLEARTQESTAVQCSWAEWEFTHCLRSNYQTSEGWKCEQREGLGGTICMRVGKDGCMVCCQVGTWFR